MAFALAHQSSKTNKAGDAKTSSPTNHSSSTTHHHSISNLNSDSPDYVLNLQRAIGNQAVQKLMCSKGAGSDFPKVGFIQPKLRVSQPGDEYEQEADRVAEQVMRMSSSNHVSSTVTDDEERIDRKCSACEMKEKEQQEEEKNLNISRKLLTMSKSETSDKVATHEISNIVSSGRSTLDDDVQELMESRFGYDFSGVRIHTDERAAQSARSFNAFAYTIGQDIVFSHGQYSPRTNEGQRILAHELVHTIQQGKSTETNYIQRACGKSEIGPTPEDCILEERAPAGKRFLFNVNCDEFAPGEEGDLSHFVSSIGPTDSVNIVGTASAEGDHELNVSLSCHRASVAASILRREGKGGNIRSVRATGGLTGTEHQRDARAVFIEVISPEAPREPECLACEGGTRHVCGPDIDPQLTKVLGEMQSHFRALGDWEKHWSCQWLITPPMAINAWDIHDLFLPETGWLRTPPFSPPCGLPAASATGGIEDPATCSNSVRVGGKCNLAGTVNYATFGIMMRACHDYYRGSPALFAQKINIPFFSESGMKSFIGVWKFVDRDDPGPPTEFAVATYHGGPSARPSTENRRHCSSVCASTSTPLGFTFVWEPYKAR